MTRVRGGHRLERGARIQELGDVTLASSGQLPEEASCIRIKILGTQDGALMSPYVSHYEII